jgi:multisubunit Na+/H+ antiporter MnhC subunit
MNTFYRTLDALFALLLINALLVFGNVWPTPWPQFQLAASPEVALLMVALALWRWRGGKLDGLRTIILAVALLVVVIGRYADVTAPALYGRPVNLYWDLPHVASVTGMLVRAAPLWVTLLAFTTVAAVLLGLFLLLRAALAALDRGLDLMPVRVGMLVTGVAVLAGWLWQSRTPATLREGYITRPVTATWVSQALQLRRALAAGERTELPPSPAFESPLTALGRRDVMVVFLESYGSATDDRAELVPDVTSGRVQLAVAARAAGLEVVSTVVTSPTFGGNSWLAHLSLLSGIEVRDPERYALLMTQPRPSLGEPFGKAGYRRVGLMPGMKLDWPEGAFYHYDTILDERRLDYRGPEFGWWRIPDQYSLARFAQVELAPRERAPVFAVFANVNTHLPFAPIPPLQADWARMLTPQPFDEAPLANALAREPNWTDMTQDYADSLRYAFGTLAGFIRLRGKAAPVMIILGDHQAAASVSGPHARWDVPVHVLAPPGPIVESLKKAGFTPGMTPPAAALLPMNELAPRVLAAFD